MKLAALTARRAKDYRAGLQPFAVPEERSDVGEIYDIGDAGFNGVKRKEARDVASHVLLGVDKGGRTRLAVTRIEAGGSFGPHVDDYGHVICVLEGRGELKVGGRRHAAGPGTVMVTEPGEPHGMFATEGEPFVLVAANVYDADHPEVS
jgi:quercetin dioxygenase-like cupin family protein